MMRDVINRIPGAVLYILLLLGGLYLQQPIWGMVCTFFFTVALLEWRKLQARTTSKRTILVSLIGLYLFIHVNFLIDLSAIDAFWVNASLISTILFYLICSLIHRSKISKLAFELGALLYLLPAFVFLFQIGMSDPPHYAILLFSIIWSGDTFAYIGGKMYGKTKLAPKVSPGKTWEGAITGVVFSGIIAFIMAKYFLHVKAPNIWFSIGILISIFGILGDLFESKLKRKHNIKDSGSIIPGHGGILDRMDSIIFALPIYYICISILKI